MNPITESSMVTEPLVDDRSSELNGSPIDRPLVERAEPNELAEPSKSIMGRLVGALMLLAVLCCGVVFGLYKMRVEIPALNTPKLYAQLDTLSARIMNQYEKYFHKHSEGEGSHEDHQITVTSPKARDEDITQAFVCQIHSRRHIDVCALEDGYLMPITVQEGQAVKEGDVLFQVVPNIYKARYDAAVAERDLAQLELNNTRRLANKQGVSQNEVKLFEAKLARAQANMDQALAELNFTKVTARFDGMIHTLKEQEGSLVKEGDILTTLSDNAVMWVYFNVPERQYLEYMEHRKQHEAEDKLELMLASGVPFNHKGIKLTVEGQFNPETGNIPFRADFPNPDGLLRHGQTGTMLIHRTLKNAVVIPQRATFEILDNRYVWKLDKDDVAHQTLITIKHELEDRFVIEKGLDVGDRIVLEGVRQIEQGVKVEFEFVDPEVALKQKNHAE
jgi:membrane fusion protein (multidrug efflux system)